MTADMMLPAWHDLTTAQAQRWDHVLDTVATALAGVSITVIDSHHAGVAEVFADRLAFSTHQHGRHCLRLTATDPAGDEDVWHAERTPTSLAVADGHDWRSHPGFEDSAVIWLHTQTTPDDRGKGAAVLIDLQDGTWPVIRHIDPALAGHGLWYRAESEASVSNPSRRTR